MRVNRILISQAGTQVPAQLRAAGCDLAVYLGRGCSPGLPQPRCCLTHQEVYGSFHSLCLLHSQSTGRWAARTCQSLPNRLLWLSACHLPPGARQAAHPSCTHPSWLRIPAHMGRW